jgi:hypothetical protein
MVARNGPVVLPTGEWPDGATCPNESIATIATMGIDIGENSFRVIALERRAIALRHKWSRGQIEERLAAMPSCLIKHALSTRISQAASARSRCAADAAGAQTRGSQAFFRWPHGEHTRIAMSA